MGKNECRGCVYWESLEEDGKKGRCHCGHPIGTAHLVPEQNVIGGQMQLSTIETTSWPITMAEAWCGEFKEKK